MDQSSPWLIDHINRKALSFEKAASEIGRTPFGEIPFDRPQSSGGRELLHELTGLKLQVSSAKISTYGEKVVDVFYVKNLFGHKVEQDDRLGEIRAALTEVLAKGNQPPTAAPARRSREPVAAK